MYVYIHFFLYTGGGQRDVALTNSLVYMLVKDNLAHSFVEKPGFKKFMKTAVPLYSI